jgi:hypothetical protein
VTAAGTFRLEIFANPFIAISLASEPVILLDELPRARQRVSLSIELGG